MKKIFFIISTSISVFATAQTETSIRAHYTDVNKRIAESIEQGFEGPLYNNHWETNKNGKSWPAVGRYSETTDFWYDDSPDHISAAERNPKNVLLKVNVTRHSSHLQVNEEYLYKDGKLVFYFSSEAEEGSSWESRLWFNNKGIVIKSAYKEDGKDLTLKELSLRPGHRELMSEPAKVQQAGKKYQDLFVKSM